jgi:hypothetical protein
LNLISKDTANTTSLGEAANVSLSIDTVVFEDGRVIGPDKTRQIAYVQDRKAAAVALANQVRTALKRGTDVSSLLTSMMPPLQLTPDNWFLFWTGQHARTLLRATNQEQINAGLRALENLPDPPAFFR